MQQPSRFLSEYPARVGGGIEPEDRLLRRVSPLGEVTGRHTPIAAPRESALEVTARAQIVGWQRETVRSDMKAVGSFTRGKARG